MRDESRTEQQRAAEARPQRSVAVVTRVAPSPGAGPPGAGPPAVSLWQRVAQLGGVALLAVAAEVVALAGQSGQSGMLPAALAGLAVVGQSVPLALRLVLGLLAVLVLPGFALSVLLQPRRGDLDGFERLALTLGLSLAQVPLLALVTDRSPWGLSPTSLVVSVATLTCVWCLLGVVRVARLAAGTGAAGTADGASRAWPAMAAAPLVAVDEGVTAGDGTRPEAAPGAARWERAALLLCGVLAAVVAVTVLVIASRPAVPPLTEFFVLGRGGLAEEYPRSVAPGEPVPVTLGIVNREGQEMEYRAAVSLGGTVLAQTPQLRVPPGERWVGTVQFALPSHGVGQRVDLLLYRSGKAPDGALDGVPDGVPYRRLQLVLDSPAPGESTPVRALQTPVPRR